MTYLHRMIVLKVLVLIALTTTLFPGNLLAAEPTAGQPPTEDRQKAVEPEEARRSQYYLHLGTEDVLQFYVHVWGQVGKPGLYLVADGTDVVGLLSLAGGPTEDAKLGEIMLVRTGPVGQGKIAVNLKRFTSSGDYSRVPVLEPGDTVVVPATFWHKVMRFGSILSVTALFANVIVVATR